uniref:Uncharacterized protein n=1 Tax=Arundo donax TaxID=35708 RepID=A0A0A9FYR6_ARUDO
MHHCWHICFSPIHYEWYENASFLVIHAGSRQPKTMCS